MENSILPSDEHLTSASDVLIIGDNEPIKVLKVSDAQKESIDGARILAAAIQMFNAADILGKVKQGAEYIVQVPAKYQAQLQTGALEMMHGEKSGKTWATIVRKLANGKQEIVCNCPITEQMRYQGNAVQGLTNTFHDLYMQQKLAELSDQVKQVYEAVQRIEQGQMDDRIGKLLSGRDDIILALENEDADGRNRELELARSKISEARRQIGESFKSCVKAFRPIPRSKMGRTFREVLSPRTNYMQRKDEEFNKLQEYYEFYLRATQLLAWSYAVVGDCKRANTVFEQAVSFLRTIDFRHVETLDYIYPAKSMEDAFYHKTTAYIETERRICLEEAKPYEYIQLVVSADELKEVIDDGKAI